VAGEVEDGGPVGGGGVEVAGGDGQLVGEAGALGDDGAGRVDDARAADVVDALLGAGLCHRYHPRAVLVGVGTNVLWDARFNAPNGIIGDVTTLPAIERHRVPRSTLIEFPGVQREINIPDERGTEVLGNPGDQSCGFTVDFSGDGTAGTGCGLFDVLGRIFGGDDEGLLGGPGDFGEECPSGEGVSASCLPPDLGIDIVTDKYEDSIDEILDNGRTVRGPFPREAGPGEVLVRRDSAGRPTNYEVYGPDGLPVKRVDLTGAAHGGVETPHVHEFERHVNPATGEEFIKPSSEARPAEPEEIPSAS
jgi:hypothetical protein